MKILITGSTGFVGRNLISYLKDSFELQFLSRIELQNISPEIINSNTAIVHLAGKAHDLKKSINSTEYYDVNFKYTKRLYDAFLQSSADKFIFISSVKAVADQVEQELFEDFNPNPKTDYGKSKLMAERYICSQPLPQSKSYYILRPCMIHGPGNKGNLNLLYKFIKKGVPYPLAGFSNRRSFLSVYNFCFIINELLIRDNIEQGIYNVADDDSLSTNELISLLASQLKTKPRLWHVAPSIIKGFAKIGDLLHLPITTERLNKLTENYIVSNIKIKKALNKQLPYSVTEGLEITTKSFSAS